MVKIKDLRFGVKKKEIPKKNNRKLKCKNTYTLFINKKEKLVIEI